MTNSYESSVQVGTEEILVRSNISYWRVPDPGENATEACDPEFDAQLYRDDYVKNYWTNQSGDWILKAKPSVPTENEGNTIGITNELALLPTGASLATELQNLTDSHIAGDRLHTFENTGLDVDWTIVMSKADNLNWSDLEEIRIFIFWYGTPDYRLNIPVQNALTASVKNTVYSRHFINEPEGPAFLQILNDGLYTAQLGHPENNSEFTILDDGRLRGASSNRKMKGLHLLVVFDQNGTTINSTPSLNIRLSKESILDPVTNQPIEIVITTPSQANIDPSIVIPTEYEDQDLVGLWSFRMLAADNLDGGGVPNDLSNLIDIILNIDYEYL